MEKYTFAFLLMSMSSAAVADGDFMKSGAMKVDNGPERAATLHIGCSSDANGALLVELVIPDANTRKDFDYDDFEGPDAHAGARSRIEWITTTGKTSITTDVAGSYIPNPPEAFQFGLDEDSHKHSKGATLIASIKSEPGTLVWTQSSDDKSKRALVATFNLDADDAKKASDTTRACLPK